MSALEAPSKWEVVYETPNLVIERSDKGHYASNLAGGGLIPPELAEEILDLRRALDHLEAERLGRPEALRREVAP